MAECNWKNRTIFHRDNLVVLRGMDSGTVDLIATDPPFQKGRDFHATPGSLAAGASFKDRWTWDKDVQQDWVDKISDDWPSIRDLVEATKLTYGEDMAAFLVWMGIRLLEMERVLKPSGTIYLHCDPTASHYLKLLMDCVFTPACFRNEIIWRYEGPQRPSKKDFGRKHDIILRYSKSRTYSTTRDGLFPKQALSESELARYSKTEDGRYFYDLPRGDYTDASIDRLDREGRIRWTRYGNPRVMFFLETDDSGNVYRRKHLPDVWDDIHSLGHAGGKERTGYATQKPLKLYERIVLASSEEGDMVLDPFCGCATTCLAAERLRRRWTGIDIWDKAHGTVLERLQKEGLSIMGDHGPRLFSYRDVIYRTNPPRRRDEGEVASPRIGKRRALYAPEEPSDGYTNAQRKQKLLEADGLKCAGCDRVFDWPEYLQLDHNIPRSEGGSNNLYNRLLLCGPCNRRKSNTLTLTGRRRRNQREGFMV